MASITLLVWPLITAIPCELAPVTKTSPVEM
jgi:hypothetical protein